MIEVKRGLQVEKVFKRSPAEMGGIVAGDVIVSVEGRDDRGRELDRGPTELIKGPEGTRRHRRRAQARAREVREADADQGPDLSPGRRQHRARQSAGRKLGYVRLRPSAKGRTRRCGERSKRCAGEGAEGLRPRPARQRRRACSRRRSSTRASSCPRARSSSRRSRARRGTPSTRRGRRQPAAPADRRPDRPQHGLGGGDPHRRPRRRRPVPRWSAPAPTARASSSRRWSLSNGGALKLTVGEYFTPDGVNLARQRDPSRRVRPRRSRDQARRGPRTRPRGARRREGIGLSRRGRPAGRSRRRKEPRNAREAVDEMLASELGRRGFPISLEVEAGRAAAAAEVEAPARPDAISRPSPSTRRPPATSTTRSPPSARVAGPGSGSTSPTSPPTSAPGSPARPSRRAGARTAPTRRGRSSRCCRRALSEDACSLAPGVERLAVTAEIELDAGGGAARRVLLSQPHPLRRAARLRPARRGLRRPRGGPRGGRRAAGAGPRGRRAARRAERRDRPRRRVGRARVPLRSLRRGRRRAGGRRRPSRTA